MMPSDVLCHPCIIGPNERDSMHLMPIVKQVTSKLNQYGIPLKKVVADGAFGSGLNGPATRN
jgi:hypothetical protein